MSIKIYKKHSSTLHHNHTYVLKDTKKIKFVAPTTSTYADSDVI